MQAQMSTQKDTRQGRYNNAPNRETHLLSQFYQHADEGSGDPMRGPTETAEARMHAPGEFTKPRPNVTLPDAWPDTQKPLWPIWRMLGKSQSSPCRLRCTSNKSLFTIPRGPARSALPEGRSRLQRTPTRFLPTPPRAASDRCPARAPTSRHQTQLTSPNGTRQQIAECQMFHM